MGVHADRRTAHRGGWLRGALSLRSSRLDLGRFERAATEAWTTLAALADETSRLRLGTLVTPLTFHEPAVLSKIVSTVCEMAPGPRRCLHRHGLERRRARGAGAALRVQGVRFERLEEYVQVLLGLWGKEPFTLRGRATTASPASCRGRCPSPARASSSAATAGGAPRSSRRAMPTTTTSTGRPWSSSRDLNARLDAACREIGREPGHHQPLGRSSGSSSARMPRTSVAALAPAWRSWAATTPTPGWRSTPTAGTPARPTRSWPGCAATSEAGLEHAMLMYAPHRDVGQIDLLAHEVLPRLSP